MTVAELIGLLEGYGHLEVEAVIQPRYPLVAAIDDVRIDVDDERMYIHLRDADRYYDQPSD